MFTAFRSRNRIGSVAVCLVWATATLGFLGCGGGGGGESGGSGTSLTPEIVLSSSSIAFGNVVINPAQAVERSVTVQNTGTGNLDIGAIAIVAPAGTPFSIVSGKDTCSSRALAPSASCSVVVSFRPTVQGPFPGSLTVPSNDADESSLSVTLAGAGKGLNVVISNVDLNCPAATPATVTVTVTDSANAPVSTLSLADFSVVPAAPLSNFTNTLSVNVSVALALDFSNSLVNSFGAIRVTANDFINTLLGTDRANVYKFAEVVDPTDAASAFRFATEPSLNAAIDAAPGFTGTPTSLFDALAFIVGKTGLEPNNRRAVILVSDGFDDDSIATVDSVIASATAQGVFIFSIGLGTTVDDVDAETLQRLATETGGLYFYAPANSDLTAIYTQISSILSKQYQFEFANPVQGSSLRVLVDNGLLEGEDTLTLPSCP